MQRGNPPCSNRSFLPSRRSKKEVVQISKLSLYIYTYISKVLAECVKEKTATLASACARDRHGKNPHPLRGPYCQPLSGCVPAVLQCLPLPEGAPRVPRGRESGGRRLRLLQGVRQAAGRRVHRGGLVRPAPRPLLRLQHRSADQDRRLLCSRRSAVRAGWHRVPQRRELRAQLQIPLHVCGRSHRLRAAVRAGRAAAQRRLPAPTARQAARQVLRGVGVRRTQGAQLHATRGIRPTRVPPRGDLRPRPGVGARQLHRADHRVERLLAHVRPRGVVARHQRQPPVPPRAPDPPVHGATLRRAAPGCHQEGEEVHAHPEGGQTQAPRVLRLHERQDVPAQVLRAVHRRPLLHPAPHEHGCRGLPLPRRRAPAPAGHGHPHVRLPLQLPRRQRRLRLALPAAHDRRHGQEVNGALPAETRRTSVTNHSPTPSQTGLIPYLYPYPAAPGSQLGTRTRPGTGTRSLPVAGYRVGYGYRVPGCDLCRGPV